MVGLPAYLANNLISSSATITPSSENSAYPKSNLYDKQAARVFRGTSLTSLTILVDIGSAQQADTVAIINHNLSASATLSLKADNSNPPTTVVASPSYRLHDIWKGFTLTSTRYWLLTVTDSNSAALEIGQLLLGRRVALPRNRQQGQGYKPAHKRATISDETYAGVFWNYHLFGREEFNPSFRVFNDADLAVLRAWDAAVYGDLWPFLYIPDASATDCYYVRKEASFEPVEQESPARQWSGAYESVHDYQMTLTEESRGLEILE